MTYSPNLPIGTGWKSTLQVAFQTLRRVKFIVESSFSFGDYNPTISYSGMTTTNVRIYKARYLKLFKLLFVSLDFGATVAAPLAANVTATIPFTTYSGEAGTIEQQGGAALLSGAELVNWYSEAGSDLLVFRRAGAINYAAGDCRIRLNTFLEIL